LSRRRVRWGGVIGVLAATLGLAACDSTPVSPDATAPVVAEPVSGINQKERAQLADSGVFRIGLADWPDDWNPWTQQLPSSLSLVIDALRPHLFDVSASGQLTPDPDWLAGPPDVVNSPVTTVTYHLNPQAHWGDGQALSATDFQATWQACLAPSGGQTCGDRSGFEHVAAITPGATAADVVVVYDQPEADWATTFRHGPARAGSLDASWTDLAAHPGWLAGPYQVTAFDSLDHSLRLTPDPTWWGDPALLDQITCQEYPADGLAAAFAAGEIDAWPIEGDAQRYNAAVQLSGLQLRRADSDRWRVLRLNPQGLLGDASLRQALLQGLDRSLIGQATWPGINWTAPPLNQLAWQPGQTDYTDLAQVTGLTYDQADAADSLDQAGWRLADSADPSAGRWNQTGEALRLTFLVDPTDPASEAEGLQIASQLGALGCPVTLSRPSSTAAYAAALAAGNFDLTTQTWVNRLRPATDLPSQLASDNGTALVGDQSSALLAAAATASDREAETELLAAAAEQLWRDVAALPLYVLPETWAVRSDVANFGPGGLTGLRWQDIGQVG